MTVKQSDLAERWELSPGRISQLVTDGMPLDSFEAAEKWRAERHAESGIAPSNFRMEGSPNIEEPPIEQKSASSGSVLETFDSIVERQRFLVQVSRNEYIKAVKAGSPQQSKLYASYDKTVNTLTKLKAESDRLAVITKEYIRSTDAADAMRTFASEVLNRLDKLALEVAEQCNPENPPRAVKVLNSWTVKVRKELSRHE
jgi:hypothetical protein